MAVMEYPWTWIRFMGNKKKKIPRAAYRNSVRTFAPLKLWDLKTVSFAHTNNLYQIRNAYGKRLDDVGEMLVESNPLLEASSFDRERAVRKHVGDYTLFLTGLFPESVAKSNQAKRPRLDAYIDFVQAGKESYAIVSSFDQFEYREEAPLFRRLSENFKLCVAGLNLVKQDLEEFQRDYYRRLRETIEPDLR